MFGHCFYKIKITIIYKRRSMLWYLSTNNHDFLPKVIDCYCKKTYLQPKEENI